MEGNSRSSVPLEELDERDEVAVNILETLGLSEADPPEETAPEEEAADESNEPEYGLEPANAFSMFGGPFTFHPGVAGRSRVRNNRRIRRISRQDSDSKEPDHESESLPPLRFMNPMTWEERTAQPPPPGHIRLFDEPDRSSFYLLTYWNTDLTLREWINNIDKLERDISGSTICRAMYPADTVTQIRELFYTNQRKRWLALKVIQTWRYRMWKKNTQCNVDMIDMAPIADRDAIFLTDTKHKQIYRFHRRDVFNSLISNICMSSEMLPCPRPPTNPWTNAELTLPQTISVIQQLVMDYARRGRCPPVLLAAFCEARYDLTEFLGNNSALLAQHAIADYFKDLHDDNMDVVIDTAFQLLEYAGANYSAPTVRRWFRTAPVTELHREWLSLAKDYTLYINLHVQARPHWHTRSNIYRDALQLFGRTPFAGAISSRMRILRTGPTPSPLLVSPTGISFLNSILGGETVPIPTEVPASADALLQLLNSTMFRM